MRRLASTEQVGYRSARNIQMIDRNYQFRIACSNPVVKSYQDLMKGKYKGDIEMIPNGGLLQETITTNEERLLAREELGISDQAFVIAHIGRMIGSANGSGLASEPKAQDVLIKAFAKAFPDNPMSLLILLGDGPLRLEAEELVKDLGIGDQTLFLGQQPEPWPALQAADIFCFPSRYEGLPNVLPEAASCGLPVVASDIPEIRSISPGDAWLLKPVDDVVEFANGLSEVFEQYDLYKERAAAAAPGIREKFSMERCAHRYHKAYEAAQMRTSR